MFYRHKEIGGRYKLHGTSWNGFEVIVYKVQKLVTKLDALLFDASLQHENNENVLVNNITNYVIGNSQTILMSPIIDSSNKNIVPRDGWVLNINSGKERHNVVDPLVAVYPDVADDQPHDASSVSASTTCLIVFIVCLVIPSLIYIL